jgi:SAM-dependent methyltransferase
MIGNDSEYTKMFEVESQHWWYKILHLQCLRRIQNHFTSKNINIVDAGCGTGGLINYLNQNGYNNISGIDVSTKAIEFCKLRGVNVQERNILDVDKVYKPNSLDVIFCNDVIYFLKTKQRVELLNKFYLLLKCNGVLIMNLPSLKIFKGSHDVAVGINDRFTRSSVESLVNQTNFFMTNFRYWPFILSPIIFVIRFAQTIQLNLMEQNDITSDLSTPIRFINTILFNLIKVELEVSKSYPWGSSSLVTLSKK